MDPHDQPITGRRIRPRAQSSTMMSAHDNPCQSSIVTTLEDRDSKRRKVEDLGSRSVESGLTKSLSNEDTSMVSSLATQDEQAEVSGSHNETQIDLNIPSSSSVPQSTFSTSASSLDVNSSPSADTVASSSGTNTSSPTHVSPSEDPLFSPRARAQELISRVSLELERDNAHFPRMDYVDPSPISSLFHDMPSTTPRAELPSEPSRDQQEASIEVSPSAPLSSEEPQRPSVQNPQPSPSPIQRIPTGTSLIVQGLVQTVARPRLNDSSHRRARPFASTHGSRSFHNRSTGHGSGQVPVFGTRRFADGNAAGVAQQNEVIEDDDDGMPSFEEQASLIGGLLSMATTATARSLLSTTSDLNAIPSTTISSSVSDPVRTDTPDEPSHQPLAQPFNRLPSRFASIVDGIQRRLNALRNVTSNISSPRPHIVTPQSSNTDTPQTSSSVSPQEEGIERVLRRFMTEAFERRDRTRESGSARAQSPSLDGRSEAVEGHDTNAASVESDQRLLETFLSGLQPSLMEALMEFNNSSSEEETVENRMEATEGEMSTLAAEEHMDIGGIESTTSSSSNRADAPESESQVNGGRRMNWMRVHRFSPRLAPASRGNGPSPDGASNSSTSVPNPIPMDERVNVTEPSHVSGSSPTNQGSNVSGRSSVLNVPGERTVVPLIMVGVRSVRAQDIPGIFASTTANEDQLSATAAVSRRTTALNSNSDSVRPNRQELRSDRSRSSIDTSANPTRNRPSPYASSLPARLLRGRSSQTTSVSRTLESDEDAVMSGGSSDSRSAHSHTRSSGFGLLRRALSGIIGNGPASPLSSPQSIVTSTESLPRATLARTSATTSDSSADTTDSADETEIRRSNSFILWVIGGLYAPDHPILTAPGLFTGHLDHDDLWTLAELLGQAKPPTATATEINSSGLTIVHGSEIAGLVKRGHIHLNTSDRCAVCLEDYDDEIECRIMGCKHVFHKECIDRWLNIGRNACPACRTKGVKVKADEQESSVINSSAPEDTISLNAQADTNS